MTYEDDRHPAAPVLPLRRPFPLPYDDDQLSEPDPLDRLTHLVFVDGRLLDAWTEPVRGTRWESAARRRDPDPATPAYEPPPPPYAQAREWLACVCGGPDAVAALDDAPLDDDHIDLPPDLPDLRWRHRLESAAELVDSVTAALFDAEVGYACRHALLAVWAAEPEVVLGAPSVAQLVGGICWAVGKANGLYGPRGVRTQASVQEALGLRQAISTQGRRIELALRGLAPSAPRPYFWPTIPDLLPLGRPDLLTSSTRRQLVQVRELASRAEQAHEPATAGAQDHARC